jgi:hypothetical protein
MELNPYESPQVVDPPKKRKPIDWPVAVMTAIQVVVVITVILVLAALLMPA